MHTTDELSRVLDTLGESGADAIGVNNRDLKTFDVTLQTSLALAEHIPAGVIRVAESGISSAADIILREAGFHAFLIGEIFMRQSDPGAALKELIAEAAGGAMSLWVKICANTSFEDALLAADAGADAVGFVFAPSPRRVTVEQVTAIMPRLPAELEKIGVFVDASLGEIVATVEASGLTGVQLHFEAPADIPAALRARFGPALRIVRTVHFAAGNADALKRTAQLDEDANIDAILVDSCTAAAKGGTGQTFDWAFAAENLFQNARARKRIAAGGLTPENVAQAIAMLRPWGVDVASGVEAVPGRKDSAKLRAFIANARVACRG